MEYSINTAFLVVGDDRFVPEELSAATGIEPTSIRRQGDPNRPHGRPWKQSAWELRIGPEASLDHESQVERLIEVIEPVGFVLADFRARVPLEVCLELWWSGGDDTQSRPSLTLSADLLSRVAALGAGIEIDV